MNHILICLINLPKYLDMDFHVFQGKMVLTEKKVSLLFLFERFHKGEYTPHNIPDNTITEFIPVRLDGCLHLPFPSNFIKFIRTFIVWACLLCFSLLFLGICVELTIIYRTLKILNSSLQWYYGKIKPLSYLQQVKKFILAYEYVPYQETIDSSYYLYNLIRKGSSISNPEYSTTSDNLTTEIVWIYIHPYRSGWCIDTPYTYPGRCHS